MSASDHLTIESSSDGGCPVIAVSGEVNLRTSPQLHAALVEIVDKKSERIVLDLSGVSYMDSSGVGTLVEIKRRVDRHKGRFVLAALQPRVYGVFEITQLHKFFEIADSVEEACKA